MYPAARPPLPSAVHILPGTDVHGAWDRFEVFEALHHSVPICNPMTSAQLDEVIDATGVSDSSRVYDAACGYGELLIRAAGRARIVGTGVDLSPWMIATAAERAAVRVPDAAMRWVLGDAAAFDPGPHPDIAVCIGAEWVWHDFSGTARALARLLRPGGVAAIGAARLHHDADPQGVRRQYGRIDTVDDMREILGDNGLEPLHRVDPDDAGWDDYLARTAAAASSWAARHPGARAQRWLDEQDDWQAARERDRGIIGWSVWIARKRPDGA